VGASVAFFSDTEESTGNFFQAGAIDLKVDNESWLNYNWETGEPLLGSYMMLYPAATWGLSDLPALDEAGNPKLFFSFGDVKPGDLGEDTLSLHVDNNPAWVCADINLTANDDMDCTEPEMGDDPSCVDDQEMDLTSGELAQNLNFIFWKDDGDNVFETDEVNNVLTSGPAGAVLNGATWAIADSQTGDKKPLEGSITYYIGKAWCFGEVGQAPVAQDTLGHGEDNGPDVRGAGVTCNGGPVDNAAQTDRLEGDVVFRAVQARHNEAYVCARPEPTVEPSPSPTVEPTRVESGPMVFGPNGWGGWSCPVGTTVVGGGYEPAGASVLISEAAQPGAPSGLYPAYPHYTYTPPETGWVVQNNNDGESINVYALCAPTP
jgi:hypothetical protein